MARRLVGWSGGIGLLPRLNILELQARLGSGESRESERPGYRRKYGWCRGKGTGPTSTPTILPLSVPLSPP